MGEEDWILPSCLPHENRMHESMSHCLILSVQLMCISFEGPLIFTKYHDEVKKYKFSPQMTEIALELKLRLKTQNGFQNQV